jgi:hypothetical protein
MGVEPITVGLEDQRSTIKLHGLAVMLDFYFITTILLHYFIKC